MRFMYFNVKVPSDNRIWRATKRKRLLYDNSFAFTFPFDCFRLIVDYNSNRSNLISVLGVRPQSFNNISPEERHFNIL